MSDELAKTYNYGVNIGLMGAHGDFRPGKTGELSR
jgi:hypothetical protein